MTQLSTPSTASTRSSFSAFTHRAVSGWVLGGLLAAGGVAMAQTPPPAASVAPPAAAATGPQAGMGGMGHGGNMHQRPHRDPAYMQARAAQREAALKARLKITASQEAAWTTFVSAMKPPAPDGSRMRMHAERAEIAKLPTPERIDKMRALRSQHQTAMNARADQRGDATKAFYAQLSSEQKAAFDTLPAPRAYPGRGGHHGQHGQHKDGYGPKAPASPMEEIRG